MRKGIVFSVDAVLALIAVMALVAWLPLQFSAVGEEQAFESLHDKAFDRAAIGLYNETSSKESIFFSARFGKCFAVYTLDPDNELGTRAEPVEQTFCEEIR